MNTSLLKKNLSNITLSKSNSNINFFTTKKSFLDKNFTSLNDVFLELAELVNKNMEFKAMNYIYLEKMIKIT